MNIVLEGHDNSGKSTLAARIAYRLGRRVISSEGPEQYLGELEQRVRRYSEEKEVIFDRHPCVSDLIYSTARGKPSSLHPHTVRDFYATPSLFIYCDPGSRGLGSHIKKAHDTPEHMAAVESHYASLLAKYRQWGTEYSHITYRIGDDIERILRLCEREVTPAFDPVQDVWEFMTKFGQSYGGNPRALPTDLATFREDFMHEELTEYVKHSRHLSSLLAENGDSAEITHQLSEQLDALVDKVYVDIGTALLHGFPFKEAWRRVHFANMKKERVASSRQSTRHSAWDIVKPFGWVAPSHVDLVENHVHRKT